MQIDGVKLKANLAFTSKNTRGKTYILHTHPAAKEITITPESNVRAAQYTYAGTKAEVKDHSLVLRISFDEFQNRFKAFSESKIAKAARERVEYRAKQETLAERAVSQPEAIRMDILVDAAKGVDLAKCLRRLNALIEEEKEVSYDEGFDSGTSIDAYQRRERYNSAYSPY